MSLIVRSPYPLDGVNPHLVALSPSQETSVTQWGYTMMTEQSGPRALVSDLVAAEAAGFDFSVISDHYSPWLESMGHASYAWSVLGAAAQATERIGLMTYVTCPIKRYHPVVVAQKAATIDLLSDGRFTLGLGSGENLNEHVVGGGWPSPRIRQAMFLEAIDIITKLSAGGYVSYEGQYFQVDSAKVWDLPDRPVPIALAVSGPQSCALAGTRADAMVGVEPQKSASSTCSTRPAGPASRRSVRSRCASTPTGMRPCGVPTSCSAGLAVDGRSMPSSGRRQGSPTDPSSSARKT
jgi:G6PDH family F420-dependent oxidoreductase